MLIQNKIEMLHLRMLIPNNHFLSKVKTKNINLIVIRNLMNYP